MLGPTPLAFGVAGLVALPLAADAAARGAEALGYDGAQPDAGADASAPDGAAGASPGGITIAAPQTAAPAPQPIAVPTTAITQSAPLAPPDSDPPPTKMGGGAPAPLPPIETSDGRQVATAGSDAGEAPAVAAVASLLPASAGGPDVADAVAAIRASADALTGAIQGLVDRVAGSPTEPTPTETAATDLAGEIGDRVAEVQQQADALLDRATGAVDSTVDAALGSVSGLATAAAAEADTLLETATAQIDATATTATDAVDGVVDTVTAIADDTLPLDIVGGIVDEALDLDTLGGADPAAGMATLTQLLEDADGYELGAADAIEPVFATVGGLSAPLDAMAADDGLSVAGVGDAADGIVADVTEGVTAPLLGGSLLDGPFDDDGGWHAG